MPEIPPVSGVAGRVAEVFAPGGVLARAVPDFEPRPGQVEMALAVAQAFDTGGVLLAEAGTGTGKTLAYLVPAILSRQRVLVSTGTKNLQEQIYFKDIPALREALGVPFTAAYMKGRANYLCLHRLDQLTDSSASARREHSEPASRAARWSGSAGNAAAAHSIFLPLIQEWSARTETGDRAELEDLPEDLAFWNDVSAKAETCLGTECPRYDDCFVTLMRQRAAAADLVIVNHHLLCADAALRQNAYGEVIPACGHIVVDEAHQLEDVATQHFGLAVSTYRIEELARDIERLIADGGVDAVEHRDELDRAVERLRDHAETFFSRLASAHRTGDRPRGEERVRVTDGSLWEARESAGHLTGVLDLLESALVIAGGSSPGREQATPDANDEAEGQDDRGRAEEVAALVRRSGELRDELRFLLRASDPDYVFFVEFRGRASAAAGASRAGVFLRASPIDVSKIVRELLLERMRTTVLTSATLTVDGTFEYIRDRLGIRSAAEIRLASEVDFARQAILYLPPRMPEPRAPDFSMAAGREVIEILRRTRGRAFVLFTSYATLREVQAIAELALSYPLLVQGTAPRSQLLKRFRETPHAVLLATSSFWQGVDVIGDALSCVIVDKLPFASPTDPITAARVDAIRARGGDPFGEYQVPLAILTLQQGLGRLIRHRRDRGVLAVLDPRLRTKGYGRRFVASLPPAPVVHDLAHISRFFESAH